MPLLLIEKVIDKFKDTRYFNILDLIWGYNNVQIKERDESSVFNKQETI